MDAILSLPVLGYFLMPSLTTYSASLNLLFFYMTWSTLVLSHPPLRVEMLGTLGIKALFWLVPSTLFLVFDSVLPSLAVSFKTQGASGLPTRTGGAKVSKSRKSPQWYNIVGLSVLNVLLGVVLQGGIEYLFTEVLHIQSALKVTTTLPMPWSIATGVVRALVIREILTYYIHRFLLHPTKPTYLSNLHTSHHHSLTSPFSFTSSYDHPLPYLLLHFLPLYLPCLLFRTHLLTYLLVLSLVTLEETLTHSGYSVIPGILLGGATKRIDLHSAGKGKGNFAPWGIMDWVHGTSVGSDVVEDMGEEAEKHELGDRGRDALEGVREEGLKALGGRKKGKKA